MEACDELYGQAGSGSSLETSGDTCGGLQAPGTGRWCTDVFG